MKYLTVNEWVDFAAYEDLEGPITVSEEWEC